jgi:hypothetical protein
MRHAIASEAKFAGFTQLEIIALFEHLPDFKRDKTEKYVRNVMKMQNAPYSCQTLKHIRIAFTGFFQYSFFRWFDQASFSYSIFGSLQCFLEFKL